MKTKFLIPICVSLLCVSVTLTGQALFANYTQKDAQKDVKTNDDPWTGRRGHAIYAEALGPGLIYSFNYDVRFKQSLRGLGARIGVGYINFLGPNIISVPMGINYIVGKSKHNLELGMGLSYVKGDLKLIPIENTQIIGHLEFLYRYIPPDGGFNFRAGITPVFNSSFFTPFWGTLSLGYTF